MNPEDLKDRFLSLVNALKPDRLAVSVIAFERMKYSEQIKSVMFLEKELRATIESIESGRLPKPDNYSTLITLYENRTTPPKWQSVAYKLLNWIVSAALFIAFFYFIGRIFSCN